MTASEIVIIGVDIGLSGGVCVLLGRSVLLAERMPTRWHGEKSKVHGERLERMIAAVLPEGIPTAIYLEQLFVPRRRDRSEEGKSLHAGSVLSLGGCRDVVIDRLWPFGEFRDVSSRVWQKALGVDDKDYAKRKDKAIEHVKRHWPHVNLSPGRCTTPQSGIADAVCLAEYGQSIECGIEPARKRAKPKTIKRRKGA